jgi:hypothetical protein
LNRRNDIDVVFRCKSFFGKQSDRNGFDKLRAHLRQDATKTIEKLLTAVANALASVQPEHCQAFSGHANYASI